ncbi:LysR family transcriptional regulator [Paenirhodobacter populi]|uniref:LysR family transcriptional regulator n=1 Tax=Paenirhodobacter populi TaxID=2306993 RepID=A0A443J4L9_9RHOB|nr:LysR family transcriptional regulator [Sinirhodobacter populi]RWR07102.1 LysR family transcriptional regulator [Sinirhodobacter populi]RWR15389.1 LysR family transcriptional regulator [Sinirhodobacter populi]RWR21430.1 LysR family transcriptional regulator [Sinirhodobacter populi]RWR29138.1 LysR family transcriptional regulator [Sinirhodobacter populi]
MNLKQIELLRTVITCKTTVKAGRELGMSQPAVSNAIKHLESQLGFPLFERVNNRLFTTEQARQLFAESEALFESYRVFTERLEDLKLQNRESLRMFSSPPLGHLLIPQAMRRFLERHSDVHAFYEIATFSQVTHSVELGLADLGFVVGRVDETQFHAETLFAEPMVCVMPPDSPLAKKSVIRPADLVGQPMISLDRGTGMGQILRRVFQQEGVPLEFVAETRYCNTACIFVQNRVGVAVVDALSAASTMGDTLIVRAFEPREVLEASVIYSKKRLLNNTAQAFLREVRRSANDMAERLASVHGRAA